MEESYMEGHLVSYMAIKTTLSMNLTNVWIYIAGHLFPDFRLRVGHGPWGELNLQEGHLVNDLGIKIKLSMNYQIAHKSSVGHPDADKGIKIKMSMNYRRHLRLSNMWRGNIVQNPS